MSDDNQLSSDLNLSDRHNSWKFRLIQLVELGAKTSAYKKNKQGGKLAMRDIAEQKGLPQFLVKMRHEAVHESQSMTEEVLNKAITRLQAYLYQSYWYPIFLRLIRRDEQIDGVKNQLMSYNPQAVSKAMGVSHYGATPPNVDQILQDGDTELPHKQSEKQIRLYLRQIINKYIKSNIKLTIPLEINQTVDLIKLFVDCSLNQIVVKFIDMKTLQDQINKFSSVVSQSLTLPKNLNQNVEFDLQKSVEVQMIKKDTFVCFLSTFQKRFSEQLAPAMILQRIISLMYQSVKKQHIMNPEDDTKGSETTKASGKSVSKKGPSEHDKTVWEYRIKLITIMALTNKYCLLAPIKKVKQNDQSENEDSDDTFKSGSNSNSDSEESNQSQKNNENISSSSGSSFNILLKQFNSLKMSLNSLHSLNLMDFFANYMYRKCKDNKLPLQKVVTMQSGITLSIDKKLVQKSENEEDSDEKNHQSEFPSDRNMGFGQLLYRQYDEIMKEREEVKQMEEPCQDEDSMNNDVINPEMFM